MSTHTKRCHGLESVRDTPSKPDPGMRCSGSSYYGLETHRVQVILPAFGIDALEVGHARVKRREGERIARQERAQMADSVNGNLVMVSNQGGLWSTVPA
jgi:hypothetical protein